MKSISDSAKNHPPTDIIPKGMCHVFHILPSKKYFMNNLPTSSSVLQSTIGIDNQSPPFLLCFPDNLQFHVTPSLNVCILGAYCVLGTGSLAMNKRDNASCCTFSCGK